MSDLVEWACPDCGTNYEGKHISKSAAEECTQRGSCQFICDCEHDVAEGHGDSLADICQNASCSHCGWSGSFPPIPWKKKDLPSWAKKALDAGWAPPKGWEPA